MTIFVLSSVIAALCIFMIEQERRHTAERKRNATERSELLDRLMARNLTEYKEQTAAPVVYEPVRVTEEEEYHREIEEGRG